MPLAKIAERHIEAGVNAAIDDSLRWDLDLAWCQDFLHHMPTVVVDQQHARPAPDGSLPGHLTHSYIGRTRNGFGQNLLLAIPDLDPKIVFRGFCRCLAIHGD